MNEIRKEQILHNQCEFRVGSNGDVWILVDSNGSDEVKPGQYLVRSNITNYSIDVHRVVEVDGDIVRCERVKKTNED